MILQPNASKKMKTMLLFGNRFLEYGHEYLQNQGPLFHVLQKHFAKSIILHQNISQMLVTSTVSSQVLSTQIRNQFSKHRLNFQNKTPKHFEKRKRKIHLSSTKILNKTK